MAMNNKVIGLDMKKTMYALGIVSLVTIGATLRASEPGMNEQTKKLFDSAVTLFRTCNTEKRQLNLDEERDLKSLFNAEIDVHATTKDGATALFWAALYGFVDECKLLIDRGADIAVRDNSRRTALLWAAQHHKRLACKILLEKGADVNVADNAGQTPLMLAAYNNCDKTCELFINHKATVDAEDTEGSTALSWAAYNGARRACKLLLDKGARVNVTDAQGRTPLRWAASRGCVTMCQLLIERGADRNAVDKTGKTPLAWAQERGHAKVIVYLENPMKTPVIKEPSQNIDSAPAGSKKSVSSAVIKKAVFGGCALAALLIAGFFAHKHFNAHKTQKTAARPS
jgi:ankyrin repeat protein